MLSDREHDLTVTSSSAETDAAASALISRYGLSTRQRVVLYTGTFEPYQGLEMLVDSAPAVIRARRDIGFVCLGGTHSQVDRIRARACEQDVGDYFILPGMVPPEEVEAHYNIASVLVSPRVSGTNTPLKIYSYLRSGVPIVATNILSHTQVLTPDVACLVEPHPESLAAGILTLLDDSQLRQRLAEGAQRLANELYPPQRYHAKVAEVFSFLASRRQGTHARAGSSQG